jgi:hypothetical protein
VKHSSDQAFGFPVYFEDSTSETGSLASAKVASHREKALAFLEGNILPTTCSIVLSCISQPFRNKFLIKISLRTNTVSGRLFNTTHRLLNLNGVLNRIGILGRKQEDTKKADESVINMEQPTCLGNNKTEKDCSASQHESSDCVREGNSHCDDISNNHDGNNQDNVCNSTPSTSSSPLLKPVDSCTVYARTAKQMPVTSNLKAVRKISNLRKTATSQATSSPSQRDKQIKLIPLSEAHERHGLKKHGVKLDSTPNLTESPERDSPLARKGATIKDNPKVSYY